MPPVQLVFEAQIPCDKHGTIFLDRQGLLICIRISAYEMAQIRVITQRLWNLRESPIKLTSSTLSLPEAVLQRRTRGK